MSVPDHDAGRYRRLDLAIGVFQCMGSVLAVYSGPILRLPLLVQLAIFLGVTVLDIVLVFTIGSHAFRTRFRRMLSVVWGALKWMALGVPGVILAIAVFVVVAVIQFWVSGDPSCEEPIDLRVVTNSEDVVPLTEASARYVAEKSQQGCRAANITVTGTSSIDALKGGFARGWTSPGADLNNDDCAHVPARVTLLGPQPDIWIPGSEDVAAAVQADVPAQDACSGRVHPVRAKADLRIHGSVGSSPVVMGVFADANRPELGDTPGQQHLAALLSAFRNNKVINSVTRPSADTAESALLSTPALYRALRDAGWVGGTGREAERQLDQGRIPASDPAALLCRFRDDDARGLAPPSDTAVIVPESTLARYNHGDALGDDAACQGRKPSAKWRLFPYYTDDLPVIEHPFVHVRWPGEDTGRRHRAVADFQKWLERDELTWEGLRTPAGRIAAGDNPRLQGMRNARHRVPESMPPHPLSGENGCVGSLDQMLGCYNDARPTYPLTVLIDISGSMANPVATGGLRLARAQEIAQRIVSRVQPSARISLYVFSAVTQPKAGLAASSNNAEARMAMLRAVQRATVNGPDLGLTTAIDQTTAQLVRGTQTLVLLTDGQPASARPESVAQARALAQRLEKSQGGLQVLVVPTGPGGCRDEPVASIDAALRDSNNGSCVGTPNDTVDDLAAALLSKIYWR